ncbi:autotransporter adhesin, partial [Paraburkholderia sp. GAS448]|uniref:YadA-like family protein n=1 Tax=Paraburkholderia sp. GAS448 TaxID=3035136 RepID=UPI003D256201
AINGGQLFGVSSSVADALGGGSTVNADGTVSAPSYSLAGGSTTVHNVGDAITNVDGRVTQNTGDISDLKDSLTGGGVIDPTTGQSLAVAYDSAAKNSVTLGGAAATAPVALKNVAAGVDGNDAVNVDQLTGALKDVEAGANPLGVQYDSIAKNSVTLGGVGSTVPVVLTNVANGSSQYDAVNFGQLSALQGQVTNIDQRVTNIEVPGNGGGVGGGGSWNNDAGGKTVTNVGNGVAPTDAANVGQLNDAISAAVGDLPAGTSAKDYTDVRINDVQGQINDVSKNAYSGIAAATALTMIPSVDPGKTLSFGIAGGSYKGYQAVALGGEARITQNIKMKAGVGISSGGTTVGAGASYQW